MSTFLLKIKSKTGCHIIDFLNLTSTVNELKEHLSKITAIPSSKIMLLKGYPPRLIEPFHHGKTFTQLGIKSGETFIVEESTKAIAPKKTFTPCEIAGLERMIGSNERGTILKRVVPADNSCLFTSVAFILGGRVDPTAAPYMREMIALQVRADKITYSAAILGKENEEYCKWIQKPDSWGGGIELAAMSNYFGFEIAVVDTINGVINRFGEDRDYTYRGFLIFDGIHYDPLYREPFDLEIIENGTIQTLFLVNDKEVLKQVKELAFESKSSKQYTDVQRFTLRCNDCKEELVGQDQALQHAKATGHMNFGEISS